MTDPDPDRFAHAMPFGAEWRADGQVRFRLWAPSCDTLTVALETPDGLEQQTMEAIGGGWFERVTDRAGPGTPYRFVLPDGLRVPDPASRFQPDDVQGSSRVVDPRSYAWQSAGWRGRPWHEAVIYELHVGAFTPDGNFDGVRRRLDHLAGLGITAVELMPLSDFPGRRNWGYDGVLPFAPDSAYGTPDDLKALIDAAHQRGMMMLLDVVYNHFGPEGNYLNAYARPFFTGRHHTPWGDAINFDGPDARPVRDFFIHNALYWLEEFRFDGLRLDAVHAIIDDSRPDILVELAETVHRRMDERGRQVHLILENDDNAARYLERERNPDGRPRLYTAQWNDDFHHVAHALLTGESGGYYADYAEQPVAKLARALTEGFVYQGDPSPYRHDAPRGEPSAHLPPPAFVNFLQNHDQIGNRAFGERLAALAEPRPLRALAAITLLAPPVPLLFMGEEWGATEPFNFFCDFHDALADAVREGRRREFARFPEFADPAARSRIPDPNADTTFQRCRLDGAAREREPHAGWLAFTREALRVRATAIVPHLPGTAAGQASRHGSALSVSWRLGDGRRLALLANLGPEVADGLAVPAGAVLFESEPGLGSALAGGRLPGWSTVWFLA